MSNTITQQNDQEDTPQEVFNMKRWFKHPLGYFSLPRVIEFDRRMNNSDFRVLVAIASFVFQNDKVFPSRKDIQDRTGIKPSNVSRATGNLERYGWVIKRQRFDNSIVYSLKIPKEVESLKPQTKSKATNIRNHSQQFMAR